MIDYKYSMAYKEVLEILKYVPIGEYEKIPKEKIKLLITYADDKYTFYYDPNKTLQEQNVSDIAKGIIIMLFRDYIASDVQKEKIIKKQNYARIMLEDEKKIKYNPNKIFEKNKENIKAIPKQEIIKREDIKWYEKVYRKLRKIFRKII